MAKKKAEAKLEVKNSITENFSGKDLRGMSFAGKSFVDCDFSDSILQGCDFTGSTFKNCKFDNADMRWVVNFGGNDGTSNI